MNIICRKLISDMSFIQYLVEIFFSCYENKENLYQNNFLLYKYKFLHNKR